jgi:uncharacterized protein YndB with AHSA1/START domain
MPAPAEVTLPSDREVRVTRQFNAPRQLVWDAHTKPDLMPKWLGYPGWDMPIRDIDLRVGGKYRWQWKNDAEGQQFGMLGTFTVVDAPSRIAHEQYFDPDGTGTPVGDAWTVSLDLSEENGVTTLVCTMQYVSKEARDNSLATGMTDGMEFSYSRLDGLVAEAG